MSVYFDNAAATCLDSRVLDCMIPYMLESYGNASSIHNFGRAARFALENARLQIASYLQVSPGEIFFTSGGTEADNTAILSAVRGMGIRRVITSALEHHAILHTLQALERSGDIQLLLIRHDEHGVLDLAHLEALLQSQERSFVSVMHGNNEIGNLNDIEAIGALCKRYQVIFHTDTVQTMGHYCFDLSRGLSSGHGRWLNDHITTEFRFSLQHTGFFKQAIVNRRYFHTAFFIISLFSEIRPVKACILFLLFHIKPEYDLYLSYSAQLFLEILVVPFHLYPVYFTLCVQVKNKDVITVEMFPLVGNTGKILCLGTVDYHLAAYRFFLFCYSRIYRVIDIREAIYKHGPNTPSQFSDFALASFSQRFKIDFSLRIAKAEHLVNVLLLVCKHKFYANILQA